MARTFARWLYGAVCAALMLGAASNAPAAQDEPTRPNPADGLERLVPI